MVTRPVSVEYFGVIPKRIRDPSTRNSFIYSRVPSEKLRTLSVLCRLWVWTENPRAKPQGVLRVEVNLAESEGTCGWCARPPTVFGLIHSGAGIFRAANEIASADAYRECRRRNVTTNCSPKGDAKVVGMQKIMRGKLDNACNSDANISQIDCPTRTRLTPVGAGQGWI